jgi:hypothetical protein
LTYLEPMEGYTILEAETEEAAKKKAEEIFQNRRNVVIVEVKELTETEEQEDFGFDKRNLN